ncbi:MAG: TonB-dependent receptor [Proteobacteria bacterium]|nr:TonB-dependent receptor [Pseudomonadota bacterium]
MAGLSKKQRAFELTDVGRAVVTACGASVAGLAAPTVNAQEVAALEEIIVTARKRSENLQDVPISVMAFGADAIAKQGIKSLEDYARLIPSLTYSSWLPGNSIVVFRGVTVTADAFSGSSSASTYFNDMPVTSQGATPEVSLVDMERIEAVSGPQPTTYGASAQSGVLKFVTAKPDLSGFDSFVDLSAASMEEGDAGLVLALASYDVQGMVNIPLVDDKFAIRLVGYQSLEGGFVDNISGSSTQTHDYSPAFDSDAGVAAYPGGFDGPSNIARVTATNADIAEDNIGDIETTGLRLTGAWAMNDKWLATAMYQYQDMEADGIASWHPELGDLKQIRFNQEVKDDSWYIATLTFEGDLGFADFTSSTGIMQRDIIYDLDGSTYLHQFQGVGGVYYNALDIAYFGAVTPGEPGSTYTYSIAAYSGGITGWAPGPGALTYYITELRDVTATMFDDLTDERFAQELRLSSKDDGKRYQWMIGGFYEKIEQSAVFRAIFDDFGNSIAGAIIEERDGFVIRNPGNSWYGNSNSEDTQWAVFGEFGFDVSDKLNILAGFRYFDAESDNRDATLNADGTEAQTCLEDEDGDCILSPENITSDNRLGTAQANNISTDDGVLPLLRITYTLNEDVLTYFTRAEGFRTGGTNIIRATSTANDSYEEDVVVSNEIGLKSTLMDGRLVFNIAAYQMTWEDMQLVAADPTISFGWGQITVNAGEAEINGVEANFALAATARLKFDGSFAYNDSKVTEGASIGEDVVISDGEELPLSPDFKASLGAELSFPFIGKDSYLRLDYSYVDEQTNATQGSGLLTSSGLLRGTVTTMDAYSIGNLIFGMEGDDWSASLSLNNIADKRAITYVPTRWADGRLYSVRPRELVLNFRKNF